MGHTCIKKLPKPLRERIIEEVFRELSRAEKKFPSFPDDIVHGSAVINEEAGELTQACLDYYYGREEGMDKIFKEAVQATAMGLRFLFKYFGESEE